MLVLSRKKEETIRVGPDVTITILRVKGHAVQIGIEAPTGVTILRGELCDPPASDVDAAALSPLAAARPPRRRVPCQCLAPMHKTHPSVGPASHGLKPYLPSRTASYPATTSVEQSVR